MNAPIRRVAVLIPFIFAGCDDPPPSFDPETQWLLEVTIVREGEANGHLEVYGYAGNRLSDCISSSCSYNMTPGDAEVRAVVDEDDTVFAGFTGDCSGGTFYGSAGEMKTCTATFIAGAAEVCDNLVDDDGSGELDCSDTTCVDDAACDPEQFGDFADDDGLGDYELVGAPNCGFEDLLPNFSLSSSGLYFETIGENSDVLFLLVDGTTNQAEATDLTVDGVAGIRCRWYESEFGNPVQVSLTLNCYPDAAPQCTQSWNATRP